MNFGKKKKNLETKLNLQQLGDLFQDSPYPLCHLDFLLCQVLLQEEDSLILLTLKNIPHTVREISPPLKRFSSSQRWDPGWMPFIICQRDFCGSSNLGEIIF